MEGSRAGEREREDAILVIEKIQSMDYSCHLFVSVFMLFAFFSFFPINAVARGGDHIPSQPGLLLGLFVRNFIKLLDLFVDFISPLSPILTCLRDQRSNSKQCIY